MKFLIKKSPDNFIKSVNDEISSILNRNFDSFFPEYILNEDTQDKYAMPVEIHEKDTQYNIKAELPGVKKEDLDIDIDKNYLTINAKRKEEHKEDTKGFRKRPRAKRRNKREGYTCSHSRYVFLDAEVPCRR